MNTSMKNPRPRQNRSFIVATVYDRRLPAIFHQRWRSQTTCEISLLAAPVAQTCSLSVSPEIVAAREDFFNHGWTRINTDEDRLSLIRVHPCSSVVGRTAQAGRLCHQE